MSKGIARFAQACVWSLAALFASWTSLPVHALEPVERLSVPGPLQLDGQQYHFAWSSHPYPQFYKQEYLPAGQTLERYRQMLMLDLLVAGVTPGQLAAEKIEELRKRKETDPVANYEVIVSKDGSSVLLDFVISAPDAQGSPIVEWNAYRYQAVPKGVLLYGISRRGYGMEGAREFLRDDLKPNRSRWIAEIAGLTLPAVSVAVEPQAPR